MKKSLLLGTMLLAACFANAAEYVFDTQASCELEGRTKVGFKDGKHVLKGACHFWSTKMFKHDPSKKYSVYADIMTDCKEKVPGMTMGFVYFNEKGRMIQTREYLTVPNGFTELAKPMSPSDTVIVIKTPAGFKKTRNWPYVLAFEAKEDMSDLPNSKVTTKAKKVVITPETITLTLEKPTFTAYPAGTKVRLHYSLSFCHPYDLEKFYCHAKGDWKTYGGSIKIPKGVKNFRPVIVYYDWHKKPTKYMYVRNFKLIEE